MSNHVQCRAVQASRPHKSPKRPNCRIDVPNGPRQEQGRFERLDGTDIRFGGSLTHGHANPYARYIDAAAWRDLSLVLQKFKLGPGHNRHVSQFAHLDATNNCARWTVLYRHR